MNTDRGYDCEIKFSANIAVSGYTAITELLFLSMKTRLIKYQVITELDPLPHYVLATPGFRSDYLYKVGTLI